MSQELTELEAEILRFEGQWPTYGGAKDRAIREQFDLSAAQYFHCLLYTSDAADDSPPV